MVALLMESRVFEFSLPSRRKGVNVDINIDINRHDVGTDIDIDIVVNIGIVEIMTFVACLSQPSLAVGF